MQEESELKIAVIGAGVIGLSSALRLATELKNTNVTLIADNFDEDTTSSGAAGLWEPYKLSDTPQHLVNRWGQETFEFLQKLLHSEEAGSAGIMETTGYQFWTEKHPDPEWKEIVPHFHRLSPEELRPYNSRSALEIVDGWSFTTIICEGALFLKWLRSRYLAAGGKIQKAKINQIDELQGYDLVINCSGLGSYHLFDDKSMYPIRGHVIRVAAPWVKDIYFTGEETYVIPNRDNVVLGGTGHVGDWDRKPRKEDSELILRRTQAMLPSLKQAKILREWVGLRPGRPSVRLELSHEDLRNSNRKIPVVHNYGHGGAGLTLAWGCGGHVLQVITAWQNSRIHAKF